MEAVACQVIKPFTPVPNPKLDRIDELADQIGELAGYLNAANCRFLELIAEFDQLGGYTEQGALVIQALEADRELVEEDVTAEAV